MSVLCCFSMLQIQLSLEDLWLGQINKLACIVRVSKLESVRILDNVRSSGATSDSGVTSDKLQSSKKSVNQSRSMNLKPIFSKFLLTLMNKVSSLVTFMTSLQASILCSLEMFLHHNKIDSRLLMTSYSRTTNVFFQLIENHVTKTS